LLPARERPRAEEISADNVNPITQPCRHEPLPSGRCCAGEIEQDSFRIGPALQKRGEEHAVTAADIDDAACL
jgi:hypothetical protein